MKFKCPQCGKIINRDGRASYYRGKQSVRALCGKTGEFIRMRKIK